MTEIDWKERLQAELDRPPFNRWLAPVAVNVDNDAQTVEILLPYRPEFSHHPKEEIFHGGILSALADMTGYAVVAVFHGMPTPTITLQIDYLTPATGKAVHARGMLRRLGRSISRADVELRCGDKLVAIARGSFSTQERAA